MIIGPDAEYLPDPVDAFPTPVPGLVVLADPSGYGWNVAVAWNGIAVVALLPGPEEALACAIELGPVADWTRPIDREAITPAVLPILDRWGAPPPRNLITPEQGRALGVSL